MRKLFKKDSAVGSGMNGIKNFENFFSNKLAEIKTLFCLVQLEAKLAELSVLPCLLSFMMLFLILMTLWFTAMGILGLFLVQHCHNFWIAALIFFGFNAILLGIFLLVFLCHFRRLRFVKTRQYLFTDRRNDNHAQ